MPQSYNHLYSQIIAFENLLLAYKQARKGKKQTPTMHAFHFELEDNLWELHHELRCGQYQPGPYRSFYITDPKRRLISAAPFRDRVVHHALCQVIQPLFERKFIFHSYANRVGKGTHKAVDQAHQWVRQYPYVLKADLRKFFPSIDHQVLLRTLQRTIRCAPTLELCRRIIDSGAGILAGEYPLQH